jgi:hypothetical protein
MKLTKQTPYGHQVIMKNKMRKSNQWIEILNSIMKKSIKIT